MIIVTGEPSSPGPIFERWGKIHSIFLVTFFDPKNPGSEEEQAYPLIDAAISNNVEHLVFSSVDRGGDELSPNNPTNVAQLASKHRIEKYLESRNIGQRMTTTILRSVVLMDNLSPDHKGREFATFWESLGEETALPFISIRDLGIWAASAFADVDGYNGISGQAPTVGADFLTFSQAQEVRCYPGPHTI